MSATPNISSRRAAYLAATTHTTLMSQRHPIQNGRTMLITTNTYRRVPVFKDPAAARIAIETLYVVQELYPFFLYGFVMMPDHCHFLLRVPEGGSISKIMNLYKRDVRFNIGKPIWQNRFHMRIIDNGAGALEYIHQNPVRSNLCAHAEDYPWSSASGRWQIHSLEWWHGITSPG